MAARKKFIEVNLPLVSETLPVLGEPEEQKNKTIKLDLSRKLKGRGLEVVFQLLVNGKEVIGYPKKMTLMRSYIQRMMRKRASYVEDSFKASCKDTPITIKPFLITRKKVSRAIKNNLRKNTKEFILEYVKTKTYMEIAESVLFGEIQKEMYPKLKKIYPLSLCEIRMLEIKDLSKADLTIKKKETQKEELTQAEELELTQAEELELELKKKKKEKNMEDTKENEKELTQAEELELAEKEEKKNIEEK